MSQGELDPQGTLRARFAPARDAGSVSAVFRHLGIGARKCDLGDESLYLAEELVRSDGWLGGPEAEGLAVLVLALMIAQRQGSTCLSLDPKDPEKRLRSLVSDIGKLAGGDIDVPRTLKTIAQLTNNPRFGSILGTGDARLPLVVDHGALYTERSRWLEERVAVRLQARLAAVPSAHAPLAEAALASLVASPGLRALSPEQAAATLLALTHPFTVITGGPGTGKTVVAAAIVRGLARVGITHVALAAQTGKAANRLTEVIGEQLRAVANADAVDRALALAPPTAQTLHRLLGYRGGRFAHHALSPLPVGAVIVDEASMVDLELVDALLDAVPAHVPLILIGDAHQLPAIDAGQILADLVTMGTRVATLAQSYRMNPADPRGRAVYEAAQAVNEGAVARALPAPTTPQRLKFAGVEYVDPTASDRPLDEVHRVVDQLWHAFSGPKALADANTVFHFDDGVIDPSQRDDLEALWSLLGRARVLTVTRTLPTGSIALNAHLHAESLAGMSVTGAPDFVPGEPVMITANDYHRGLFNGDQGIIVRADEGLGRHHYRAVFRIGGELRPFAIEALRDRLELAWALTVHKSQGSELDAVALVLPFEPDMPLVTRELVYTGITRARTSVVLCAAREVLIAAGKRRALRFSGLPLRIAAAAARASACEHDVIINGVCDACGATNPPPPPKPGATNVVPIGRLTKPR